MAQIKYTGLTAAVDADVAGTAITSVVDATLTNTLKVTLARLRKIMLAGGTGYTAADPLVVGTIAASGQITGNVTGALTGNADTATKLAATKTINGVAFDGSGNITVTAAASTLSGTTLPALNGAALTALTAANIVGVIPIANLATGTPTGSKFVRDDGTLAVPAGGGGGSGDALTTGTLAQFAATTSAQLAGVISDETGTGKLVFGTNPTLIGATLTGALAAGGQEIQQALFVDPRDKIVALGTTGGAVAGSMATAPVYTITLNANATFTVTGMPATGQGRMIVYVVGDGTHTFDVACAGTRTWLSGAPGVIASGETMPVEIISLASTTDVFCSAGDAGNGTVGTFSKFTAGGLANTLLSESGTVITSTGRLILPASSTTQAPLNIPHGTAPTSPVDGDVWTTSAGGIYARINGVTVGPLATGGGSGSGTVASSTTGQLAAYTGATTVTGLSYLTTSGTTLTVAGTVAATTLTGAGSGITSLSGTNIGSGTVADARLPSTMAAKTLTGPSYTKAAPTISSNVLTLDYTAGPVFHVALNANITTFTLQNWPTTGTAGAIEVRFTSDGTQRTIASTIGGVTPIWEGGIAFVPPATNNHVSRIVLKSADALTTLDAFIAMQNGS